MALFMDTHKRVLGLTAESVVVAHQKDLKIQGMHGVKYLRYWFNEKERTVHCLVEAPTKDAAIRVHREAHGLVPDEILEVREGE